MNCIMGGCRRQGAPNYICALCSDRKIFCCEGCEVELLNDLRALGKIYMHCLDHKSTQKTDARVKEIDVPGLLKRSEQFREKLISEQKFEDSVILRDLAILVRASKEKRTHG